MREGNIVSLNDEGRVHCEMSPPKNSHKLSEAFAEYLPDGSKYIFLLVERTGEGAAWVSTMSTIQDPEMRAEVLRRAADQEEE